MRERTAQPRRKQGRAPHRDRLGKIYKAPQQNDLHQLRRRQGQAARQQPGLGALIDKPPHRGRSHRRRAQFDAQQGGLERYPRRQRAHRCRQAVGRRAADDQRQPKGGRPASAAPCHSSAALRAPGSSLSILVCKRSPLKTAIVVSLRKYTVYVRTLCTIPRPAAAFCRRAQKPENNV